MARVAPVSGCRQMQGAPIFGLLEIRSHKGNANLAFRSPGDTAETFNAIRCDDKLELIRNTDRCCKFELSPLSGQVPHHAVEHR